MKSLKNLTPDQKETIYLDWVNNYLTTEKMAIDYDCSQKELIAIIDEVRNIPKPEKIEFTRINNDVNGNPRYVVHFLEFITDGDRKNRTEYQIKDPNFIYNLALKRARTIGGRKFNNKQYGGGIVFQSYNIHELEKSILELKNSDEK